MSNRRLLERRGVHHLGADVGGDRFPDAWREQHEGRRDLAQIVHHRVGLFDEVDLHPAQQAFAEHIDLLHDPGQRQHRDILVVRSLRVEGEIGRAMAEHAAGGEHRELRMRGGARRGAEDRDVFAPGRVHQPVVEFRFAYSARPAELGKRLRRHQPRIVIFPHAARIGIDDVLQSRHAVGKHKQLVDLLLVLGKDELRFAVVEKIGGFFVQHVAIKPEAQSADRVGGDFRCDPVRPVVADDADDIFAPEAQFDEAKCEIAHPRLVVVPGERAPQPKILLAQRDLVAVLLCIQPKHLGIGVGLCDAARIVHHAALSCAAGLSSGSTSTSSSSPR